MTSSAVASSGPSWQVDIPGLSQLILNVGSHGLKQLAMAGVDIHSIGCMLMIAEYTPTSQDFRKKIIAAREAQRSERIWFYRTVEFGTATNFLADQLLKTRAGENVLALMAATVPVMDEGMCTTTLATMFEDAKVSLDNIPGLSQLKAIRTALVSLARKVGLGEKILNYHKFLCSLTSSPRKDPYFAIPVAKDVASIIRMLHKVVSNEEPYILICWGIRGAAWVLAYASDVLGLPVCALRSDRTAVPVTGSYDDAKVLLEIDSTEDKYSLYMKKDLQEQFKFQDSDKKHCKGWSLDCTKVNFLDYCHPGVVMSESLEHISAFTALETLNYVSALARVMPEWETPREWVSDPNKSLDFIGILESELSTIQARSLKILWHLGFLPGSMDQYEYIAFRHCPTYKALRHLNDPPALDTEVPGNYCDPDRIAGVIDYVERAYTLSYGQYTPKKHPRDIPDSRRLRYYIDRPNLNGRKELSTGRVSFYQRNYVDWLPHMQEAITDTIDRAAYFAAHLAFSDWDTTVRQMSARFLRPGSAHEESPIRERSCFEARMEYAIPLCTDGIDIVEVEARVWTGDWLALDLGGLVVHRYAASRYSIHDLHGRIFGFVTGRIISDGTYCSRVRSDRVGLNYDLYGYQLLPAKLSECGPKLGVPDLSLRTLLSTVQDTLFVRLEAFLGSTLALVGDISRVNQSLPNILISKPCDCGYRARHLNRGPNYFDNDTTEIHQGLSFLTRESGKSFVIHYQLVDDSPVGQWLACHWRPPRDCGLIIIQQDCCIGCILRRVYKSYHLFDKTNFPEPRTLHVCVIAGGIDEPSTSQQDHGSPASLPEED